MLKLCLDIDFVVAKAGEILISPIKSFYRYIFGFKRCSTLLIML